MSATEQHPQRVEYRTVKVGLEDPEPKLRRLAAEGWQIAERIDADGSTVRLVMEREVNGGESA